MNISSSTKTAVAMIKVSNQLNTNKIDTAHTLFTNLDSDSKGYISVNDITKSFSAGSTFNAQNILDSMDSNHDQKVSETELQTRIELLSTELNNQLSTIRSIVNTSTNHISGEDSEFNSDLALLDELTTPYSDADSNQDGVISLKEKVEYELKQALTKTYENTLNISEIQTSPGDNIHTEV